MAKIKEVTYPSKPLNEKRTTASRKKKTINSVETLTDYIRRQLGEPLIKVEVTDEQIEDCIFTAIDEFCEYGFQGLEDTAVLVTITDDQSTFILDDRVRAITNIRALSNISNLLQLPGGLTLANSNFALSFLTNLSDVDITGVSVQLSRLSMIQSIFDVPVNYRWNEHTKELTILENHKGKKILLEMSLQYEPKEEDPIYNQTWVKKNSVSRVKYLWGNNTGKYSTQLVNGATINYDRLLSEATQELQDQKEELLETYREPLGIYVL